MIRRSGTGTSKPVTSRPGTKTNPIRVTLKKAFTENDLADGLKRKYKALTGVHTGRDVSYVEITSGKNVGRPSVPRPRVLKHVGGKGGHGGGGKLIGGKNK